MQKKKALGHIFYVATLAAVLIRWPHTKFPACLEQVFDCHRGAKRPRGCLSSFVRLHGKASFRATQTSRRCTYACGKAFFTVRSSTTVTRRINGRNNLSARGATTFSYFCAVKVIGALESGIAWTPYITLCVRQRSSTSFLSRVPFVSSSKFRVFAEAYLIPFTRFTGSLSPVLTGWVAFPNRKYPQPPIRSQDIQ